MLSLDCGIDIGSTNTKVVFVAEDARPLHTLSIATPRIHDGISNVTDPLHLVAAIEQLIITGWRHLNTGHALRSITTAGIGEDGFGLGANGMPTGSAIQWHDRRASAEASDLGRLHQEFEIRAGIKMNPTLTAAKWMWLRNHCPTQLEDASVWVTLTDFPAIWWTGKPFMSNSLAPRTACFDVYERSWIPELLAAAKAPSLPAIAKAGQVIGGVRSGPLRDSGAASTETIVVAGGHDHPIAATTIRRFDPHARVDSMGTANLIYGEAALRSQLQPTDTLSISVSPIDEKVVACLGVLELKMQLRTGQSSEESLAASLALDQIPGNPTRSIEDLETHSADAATQNRRVLERASFAAHKLLNEIAAAGVADGPIFATGGWARSKAFLELRASIFGQSIHALGDLELVAIGAALFGVEAATGKSACPFSEADIRVIQPVDTWVTAYANMRTQSMEN